MINLILAIASSALISILMRYGDDKIENNMGMFIVNYLVCALLSKAFMGGTPLIVTADGIGLAVGLGIVSGIMYLLNFVLLKQNIQKNGVVLSSIFMKLGVIIPTIMAILIFHEKSKLTQIIGVILALAAIVMIHFEKEDMNKARFKYLLVILLLASGFTDSLANVYDKLGNSDLKDHYLLFTFAAAAICAGILWVKQKEKMCRWDVIFGICIGVPNYFSARFLLGALHQIPAVIVYPVYSVLTIVTIIFAGVLIFGEKLSRKKVIAILMIFAALVLLNLS